MSSFDPAWWRIPAEPDVREEIFIDIMPCAAALASPLMRPAIEQHARCSTHFDCAGCGDPVPVAAVRGVALVRPWPSLLAARGLLLGICAECWSSIALRGRIRNRLSAQFRIVELRGLE